MVAESDCDDEGERRPLLAHEDTGSGFKDFFFAPLALGGWFKLLQREFGIHLLTTLFCAQHILKGFVFAMVGESRQWVFKEYHVPGPTMQIYQGVIMLPWAVKPILGLLSDLVPICGYNKNPYIIIFTLLGVAGVTALGVSGVSSMTVGVAVGCFFLVNLQVSGTDLLTEAKYVEALSQKPQFGPDLLTYVWGGIAAFEIVAIAMLGWMITTFGARAPCVVAIIPAAIVLWPVALNYMNEQPRTSEEVVAERAEHLKSYEAFVLCVMMFFSTVSLSWLGMMTTDHRIHFWTAVGVMLVMLIGFSVFLTPIVAKVNAFFLLQTSLKVSIGGAAFYFYTNTEDQYRHGPHFSVQFYSSTLGLIGSACTLIGLAMYNRWMKEWKYRSLLLITSLLLSALAALDVLIFTRYNLKLGIPDKAFVVGSEITGRIIGQWQWMPGIVMMSQLCPQGLEATMYALLAGCHNLGAALSDYMGAYVLQVLDVHPAGSSHEDAEFDNLWKASLISTGLPLLTLLLIPIMIPDAKQTDSLLPPGERSATRGSIWRKLRGIEEPPLPVVIAEHPGSSQTDQPSQP